MRMASTRENSCPTGYFGLKATHGSITITSPEGSWNWNVPCPSHVICIPRSFYGGGHRGRLDDGAISECHNVCSVIRLKFMHSVAWPCEPQPHRSFRRRSRALSLPSAADTSTIARDGGSCDAAGCSGTSPRAVGTDLGNLRL